MANEKLGPPLNIDKYLGKAKNRIHQVGIELEGGWKTLAGGTVRPEHDGSVKFGAHPDKYSIQYLGEVASPALPPKEYPEWMRLYYPTHVNETCGMHVHVSTITAFAYQRLMVNKPHSFPATMIEYIRRWAEAEKLPKGHTIWPRLENKNEFCQHTFQAEDQCKASSKDYDHHRPGHRYSVIAYRWGTTRTLECRLLPMMETADQGVRAVAEVIRITNAFLAATAAREPKKRIVVMDDDQGVVEERRSYV